MGGRQIRGLIADIEGVEEDAEAAPEPGQDMVMLPIPMPTYKAMSDAAAKKNMTMAQLVARAFSIALQED
jgi:hypothetical protein